jgi:hypothetical protein
MQPSSAAHLCLGLQPLITRCLLSSSPAFPLALQLCSPALLQCSHYLGLLLLYRGQLLLQGGGLQVAGGEQAVRVQDT